MMEREQVRTSVGDKFTREAPGDRSEYFELLRPLLRGIVAMLGHNCEAVLHDFRDPEHTIVAIEGNVTGRHVGGSVSQLGLGLIADGDEAEDQLNYLMRSASGRVIKSSTILLRDASGHVFGAFCVNLDVTDIRLLADALREMAGPSQAATSQETFGDSIDDVVRAVVDEEEARLGRSIDRMGKQERVEIFRALDRRGVFLLQRSVSKVAEYLGISRSTAYGYLDELRAENARSKTVASPHQVTPK